MRFKLWNGNCVVYDFSTITKVFPSLESENAVKYYTQNDKDSYTTTILKNKEEVKRFIGAYEEYVMLKNFPPQTERSIEIEIDLPSEENKALNQENEYLNKEVQLLSERIKETESLQESHKALKESFEKQKGELVELKNKCNLLLDSLIESQLSKQNETKAEEGFSSTSVERKLLDKLSEGKEIRSYLDSNNKLHFYVYTDAEPVIGDLVEIVKTIRESGQIHQVVDKSGAWISTESVSKDGISMLHCSFGTYKTIKLL